MKITRRALLAAPVLARCARAAQSGPHLLLGPEDFARIARNTDAWAVAARDSIVKSVAEWPAAQVARYGLDSWSVPPEGGQWTLWYVCPTHGVYLTFRGPGQNVCPVDNKNYTGWPYDQVIYMRRHSENATAARDNALAYRLTGKPEYARAAAAILLAYADAYLTYALKDINNKVTSSAGRVSAQTLDEAGWIIPMAWAYDLVADSGALDAAQCAHVEDDLLRAAASVIARYNATRSNWQSWHNAGIGAVGFTLGDAGLISKAIDGSSGFRYQMRESVLGDGTWWEGAWGYHFYALDSHSRLALMAARGGYDLFAEPALRRMFEAPLRLAMPDGKLPPFNDSGAIDLATYARLYEVAYASYDDPAFAAIAARGTRSTDALFWGKDTLPAGDAPPLASAVFPDSGNAVLRAGTDHYVALKFGPDGGGHGHFDKLGMVNYARGGVMAVDPGTQSYAAPTHNTWDRVTLAHNTVVVDEKSQAAATGELIAFAALPAISAVRAGAGAAYRQAALERSLFLTPEYAVDIFDGRSLDGAAHRFDWIYHNYGRLSAAPAGEPYTALPRTDGYQHLSGAAAAVTPGAWQASFDMNDAAGAAGSIYVSPSGVGAAFQYSREQAAGGAWSGRMQYDFSNAKGYILYQLAAPAGVPASVPSGISMAVYGDGSGHRLAVRLYDTSDERFVYTVGPVTWTGWRTVTAYGPESWQHYLGNANGVFDPPLKSVAIEVTYLSGGPVTGALYVDDIVVEYPSGNLPVADFERNLRSLRVWMPGAPDTTVVTGKGLGPDLRQPMPFVMARRSGTEARFAALLEPYGDAPAVTDFRAGETFEITAADFADRLSFTAGALRFVRRNGNGLVRAALAGADKLEDGGQVLIACDGTPVQVDYGGDALQISVAAGAPGSVTVYAPAAQQVFVNGAAAAFRRDGDYVEVEYGTS